MKKKLLTIGLCTVLLFALSVFVAAAEDEELSDYQQFVNRLVPGSTINIDECITIPANTHLDLNGCTVIRRSGYAFELSGNRSSIENGTISGGGIRVDEDDPDGYIRNLQIKNPDGNGIFVSGSIGDISGCTITGSEDASIYFRGGSSGNITGNTITDSQDAGIMMYNKSSCGNILRNNISNCEDHGIRLFGSSSDSVNNGCSAGDIMDNTITNCGGHGISLYHGSHCGKINGNTLKKIGGKHDGNSDNPVGDFGIMINSGCPFPSYAAEITYNTLDTIAYAGIDVLCEKRNSSGRNNGAAYIEGDIAYNTVTNTGTWNKGIDWSKGSAGKLHPCEGSIYVDSYAEVRGDIHDNTISNSNDNGICVLTYSRVNDIYGNDISKCKCAGINAGDHSVISGDVYENKIKSSKVYGIMINNGSKADGSIRNNTVTSTGKDGIAVMKGSKASKISSNNITGSGLYGVIAANSNAVIDDLSKNKISVKGSKDSMGIICNSGCAIKKISGNKISGKFSRGIRIKDPTAKITIKSNTTTAGSPKSVQTIGISIQGCKNKTITVTSNKITGNNTGAGIYIQTSSGVIKKNTVKKSRNAVSVVKGRYKVKIS